MIPPRGLLNQAQMQQVGFRPIKNDCCGKRNGRNDPLTELDLNQQNRNMYFSMFKRINILPQWAIFFIDIFIAIISLFIAYVIRYDFSLNLINRSIFLKNAGILISICIPVFIVLKTYAGIIRLTTIQDAFKIFIAVVLINSGFVAVYLIASVFFQKSFFSITTLLIK